MNQNLNSTEAVVLSCLMHRDDYKREVFAYLEKDYFQNAVTQTLFEHIHGFINTFNKTPTKDAIEISLQGSKTLTQDLYNETREALNDLWGMKDSSQGHDLKWLRGTTENWAKNRAAYNAVLECIGIIDGKEKSKTLSALPEVLRKAVGVTFDSSIGHDWLLDAENRFDFYHRTEERFAFDIKQFNEITGGGITRKTMTVILASTGVGKSAFMCHMAATYARQGLNVLYISCEMSEERIAERIDANILDISMDDLKMLDRGTYLKKLQRVENKKLGKLIIKEYPTASANVNHMRHLVEELETKKNFKPDVLFVDYLNICASARFRDSGSANSYTIVKAISEELRGLAIEKDLALVTATQTNRSGVGNSDVSLTETSDSMGIPMTADLLFALISTPELEQQGQILVKQLKNRYGDLGHLNKFVIGSSRPKMKFYQLEESAQRAFRNPSDDSLESDDSEPDNYFGHGFGAEQQTKRKSRF